MIMVVVPLVTLLCYQSWVRGSVAYVAQQAWILNTTLRENVLFGLPFDEARYKRALDSSCLTRDIDMLPAKDMTEIGTRHHTIPHRS